MPHALIVEDDVNSAQMLATLIKGEGFSAAIATSLKDARQQLAFRTPNVVLLDLMLPDGSGMELFEDRAEFGNVEIILITGHATVDTSIQAMRLGAADYLIKPIDVAVLKGALSRVGQPLESKAEIAALQKASASEGRFGRLLGRTPIMRNVYAQIGRVAPTAVTVMVTGESGTGKEVVAQTIHDLSRRRKEPFLAVNCGAVSANLIESEMFGHEKGSFTGANRQHKGYFERAHGGTLFLDEITEMPSELQVKLLRVLETGTFLRVGSDESIVTDVRIIAATNRVPREAVAAGKLREDLFYRLNVFQIHVPPLRDRLSDIELLAPHFLKALNEREKTDRVFDPRAIARLQDYDWPGNVRELRNVVQRAYIMSEGATIGPEAMPFDSLTPRAERAAPSAPANGGTITINLGSSVADVERQLILATLSYVGGQKDRAAEVLGISAKTLYNRLREYGASSDRDDGAAH